MCGRKAAVPKGIISITGDEYAVKYPQPPNAPGIFKQLLDDIDQRNPRSFALPVEIRTYFKGVETNSDGEYVDTLDYKPSESIQGPGPHGGYSTSTTMDDMVQLRDKQGDIRICFHCGKSAHGRKLMISCEHCPLHWHLDCLDPPLASRPPTTRKWMCPNHVDHVLPKRRKRRDAHPVELVDPFAPNDGDIEIIDETSIHQIRATQIKASLMGNPVEALYKIPERSQRSFQGGPRADPRGGKDETRLDRPRFEVLVAVMLACEGMEMGKLDSTDAVDAAADATVNLTDTDVAVNVDEKSRKRHREEVQDAVTSKLTDSEDRDAYARFLAVQRAVREHGVETSIAQWTEAFQRDGDEKK
ncbi:hypothetical protein BGZ99_007239 [Dissophora globulifera]|uniref:Zinc finger PHD-type domain-containing protein n=1 Tax=Dissophora globulifera TaxID=979702 RepID=A0A9P6RAC6_9FUNG|nr:hypothetical protein BGZ99_007239 [Dissophora globulifera]